MVWKQKTQEVFLTCIFLFLSFFKYQFSEFALILSDTVLRALSTKLGSEWEPLATYLESTREEIHRTKVNYSTVGNQIFNLLVTWRQRQPAGKDVKETLATALRNCGRKDLGDLLMGMFSWLIMRLELRKWYYQPNWVITSFRVL